ncbi:MAG: glycosyltransferase [Verrucomicrobia bacterium]|nr:glycosyltransferase [Verrucomicrobiota bacterium]MBS0645492.1 glycosyltransferase [Verrucomicrobiota bacterium]
MRITIPYNEILPTGKAHDRFLFREASELTKFGCEVRVMIGRGSQSQSALCQYYGTSSPTYLHDLPIVRKNNPLGLSWNMPFFWATRHFLKKYPTDIVLMSVLKQAADLLKHRCPHTFYVYEAHELAYYPHQPLQKHFELEKYVLQHADLICVTTQQLKQILQDPPYQLTTPVAVIPLAVDAQPLPPPSADLPPTVTYVGQLYKEQGMEELLQAMDKVPHISLRIIGGKPQDIARLNKHQANVSFEGFISPSHLQEAVMATHAFIAPFQLVGRMPYVAHTKLYDYQAWGRTIIAPDCEIVKEHLVSDSCLLYTDFSALVEALNRVGQTPLPQSVLSPWDKRIHLFMTILEKHFKKAY